MNKVSGQIFQLVENSSSERSLSGRLQKVVPYEPQEVSSEKMSEHIYCMEDNLLHCADMCSSMSLLKFFLYFK